MRTTLIAIVPALNEEQTVATVIRSIRDDLGADVLVVDDGSSDDTAAVAAAAGAMVVSHPFNLGVGAAMRTGFRFARRNHYEVAIQIDADGQHIASEAQTLIELVRSGAADLAVGSRFGDGSGDYRVSGARRWSMRVLSAIVSRRLGMRITDTTSGFRAFSERAIDRFALEYPSAYLSDTVESLLIAHYDGLTIVEVPVTMLERMGGVASNNVIRSGYHLVRLLLVIALSKHRRSISRGN